MIRRLAAVALVAALPAGAEAQSVRRVEIAAGGGLASRLSLGARDAALQSNDSSGSPFRLFSTDTRLDPAPHLEVRLGYRLSRRLALEGALAIARPRLTSSLDADAENAAAVEAAGTVTEYVVDGGARWQWSTSTRRRWAPFVSGGAGIARHAHEGKALIETGVDVYGGGGLVYVLAARTGLRLDGTLHILSGGIAEGQSAPMRGVLSGSFFVLF